MPGGGKLVLAAENARLDAFYATKTWMLPPGAYVVLRVSEPDRHCPWHHGKDNLNPFFHDQRSGRGMVGPVNCTSYRARPRRLCQSLPASWAAAAPLSFTSAYPGSRPGSGGRKEIHYLTGQVNWVVVDVRGAIPQLTGRFLERKGYTAVIGVDGTMPWLCSPSGKKKKQIK